MRAMVLDKFGGPDVLHMAEVETPKPGPDEVVIRVAYAGVNPADWKCREGWLAQFFQYKFPFIVGFDAAGVVSDVGPGVAHLKVGDRVATNSNQGQGDWGTYAEFVRAHTFRVAKLGDALDFKTAAAIPTAAVTSWHGIFTIGQVKPGQSVLVHGGAGGCGSFGIQFAKHAGARVAATCGPSNLDYVRSQGADLAIDYRSQNVRDAVLAWAPGGVDFVLDTVGQGTLKDGLEMVKRGGGLGYIGTLIANEPLFQKDHGTKRGVRVDLVMSDRTMAGDHLRTIVELYNKGKLKPVAMDVLPLDQAGEAHRRVQAGHVRGKILLKVADI